MDSKRTIFPNKGLPYLLLAPQIAITLVFFVWPASQTVSMSFQREDPFGLSASFVGLGNYIRLFEDPLYLASIWRTILFAAAVTGLSMGLALLFAVAVSRLARTGRIYATLLMWPYAVSAVIAGILWWFIFNSVSGPIPQVLELFGIHWNHQLNGAQAMSLIIIAASWKQISYNFLFFLAGLQSVPQSLIEAAAIDGSGPVKRFFTITLPLLAPTTFFLFVMNINYTMFETFGIVDATTSGGPAQATNIMVYKVFQDGYVGGNLGSSSAQSVILMLFVIGLTVLQFRFIERRMQYAVT